ncbi:MAG: hypothetical protein AAEJ57_06835, partial [Opitutales bacterium]
MRTTAIIFKFHCLVFMTGLWGQQAPPPPTPLQPVPPATPERSSQAVTIERAGRDLADAREETRLGAAKLLGKYK